MKTTRTTLPMLALAALVIGLVIVLGVQLDRATQEEIVTRFSQRQLLLAEQTAAAIQSIFDEARRDLLCLTDAPGPDRLADALATESEEEIATWREVCEQGFSSYLRSNPMYAQIRYIDASGQEIVGADTDGETVRLIPQDQLRSQAERGFFVATKQLDAGAISVSPLEPARGHGGVGVGLLTVRLVTPVFDSRGQRAGVIVLNLLPGGIGAHIARLSVEERVDAWVLDERGVEIINVTHPELEGSNAYEYCRQTGDEALITLVEDMMAGGRGTAIYLWPESMGGPPVVKRLAAYAPIYPAEGQVWSVGTSVTYDSILAEHRQTRMMLIFLGGSITTIVLVGVVLTAQSDRRRAVAEERARFSETLRRRGEELEALQEISLAITAQLELDELLQNIVERGCRLLDVEAGTVYLVDESRGDLQLIVSHGYARGYIGTRLSPGEGLSGQVLQSGEPLVVDDYHRWEGRSPDWEAEPLTALLGVPLKRGEQVIGVLDFGEMARARSFDEHDVWLATLFASQAAIAIENARLFQDAQAARERADTLREVSRVLGSTLKLDAVLSLVLRQARRVLAYDTACILLFADDQPSMVAVVGYGDEELVKTEVPLRLGDSLILQSMARDRRPVIVADVREDERWIWVPGAEEVRSWIGAPLLVRDEMVGALMIDSTQPGFYTAADAAIAQALANQAAVAIQNAQLYEQVQHRLESLTHLNLASQVITSSLDVEDVLEQIVELAGSVVNSDYTSVVLLDEEGQPVLGAEDFRAVPSVAQRIRSSGVTRHVLDSGQPVVVDAISDEGAMIPPLRRPDGELVEANPDIVAAGIRSFAAVPIQAKGRMLGVAFVHSRQPRAFHGQVSLLTTFANQAAVAIENARLFEAERQQRAQAEALREAGVIVSSALGLDEVLERLLEQVERIVPSDSSNVLLIENNESRVAHQRGYERFGVAGEMARLTLDVQGTASLRWMVETGQPYIISDTRTGPDWVPTEAGAHIRSYVGVPIIVGDEVIGCFSLDKTEVGFYRQEHAEMLTTFARQAAVAIENAHLFEAEQRRRQEAETLRETALALTTSLDRNQVIERILIQLQQVVPYDSASIQLLRGDCLELIGGRGFPNLEELLGVTFELAVEEDNPNREVILTRAPFILEDAPAVYDRFRRKPYVQTIIRSWLGAPMLIGDQPIGMITLDKREPGFYTEEHAQLALAFAAQSAVAVENARLYEQARQEIAERKRAEEALERRATQLATVGEVGRQITSLLELDPLLDHIVNLIREAFNYRYVSILLVDPATEELALRAGAGYDVEPAKRLRFKVGQEGICGWVAASGEPLLVGDVSQEPRYCPVLADTRSELTVPIRVKDQVIGVLDVQRAELEAFDEDDIFTLQTLADQVGVAIENARLHQETWQQAQQVQQIMDTVPEGVLLLDTAGQVILANPMAETALPVLSSAKVGDTLTHLGGRPLAELLTSPPRGLWHEVTVDGPPRRCFEVIARPMEVGPKARGWVLVIRDVTWEREIQQRVQQQGRLAAVGQLAAGIAHDFNNIMAVIVLYSHMTMRAPDISSQSRQRLETITRQANQASNLIGQILDFSRQSVLERRPLELASFLKELVELLQRTLPENIQVDLVHGAGEYTVNADPTRLQQVMMNLAINARDAMPKGGPLRIGLERIELQPGELPPLPEMKPGEWLQVTVTDSGMGIPAEALPHIFEPFFTTKAPGEGTGLGLAQVYGIVKQHEGHIDVQSQVGRGTTFTLYWPALSVSEVEMPAVEEEDLVRGRGETLLIVEDDPTIRRVLRDALEELNYRTLEAANGREALAIFEQRRDEITLVMSDLVMPEMGGAALLHALREQDPAVKVVVVSGYLLPNEVENLKSQGVTAWLQKPLSLDQLAQVVAQALKE